jgi:acetyl esterase/lipase
VSFPAISAPTIQELAVRRSAVLLLIGCVIVLSGFSFVRADDAPAYTRTEDVIYGRKYGMALTLDVLTPKKNANGAAVIAVISGGFRSSHEAIRPPFYEELLNRGYTVFAVVHGSQPKFTIPEILEDMNRAVRFIRYHAKDYRIDPERIGITGGSAGGHLSLMQGTAGDKGNPKAKDPIDQTSSRVQAVACFFPATDFLNWGEKGHHKIGDDVGLAFRAAFDYHEFDKTSARFMRITDDKKLRDISHKVSPIYHVSSDDPPTLIIHGDKDGLVPLQQSQAIVAKLKEVGVPAQLVVKEGAEHGWPDIAKDMVRIADWFDMYLQKGGSASGGR